MTETTRDARLKVVGDEDAAAAVHEPTDAERRARALDTLQRLAEDSHVDAGTRFNALAALLQSVDPMFRLGG